jgi:hypothetical protein
LITVHKYKLKVGGETEIRMPKGAGLLHFSYVPHNNSWCLWALVDTRRPEEIRTFTVYGTGFEIQQFGVYVGTALSLGGDFVLHLFEVKKSDA